MIDRLFANPALVVVLSGTVATLVAHGPGRLSLRRALSGALSNPVPRMASYGASEDISPSATEHRSAA